MHVAYYDGKTLEYDLILTKMDEEPITELKNIKGLKYIPQIAGVSEITFSVPKTIMDNKGKQKENYLYDAIEGNFMVLVNDMEYFILKQPVEAVDSDGELIKSITGYSREYELRNKILMGYEGVSRAIYDPANEVDENGLQIGFLNYVEKVSSWKVGYVSPEIIHRRRMLSFPKTNILQSFQEIQEIFDCLLRFNTKDKIIDVLSIDQLGADNGLFLTDENYISDLKKTTDDDSIVTRLYLYGQDNISIQSLTITGQPYIENYNYFMKEKYMSKELIDGLNKYYEYIDDKKGEFQGLLKELEPLDKLKHELDTTSYELSLEKRILEDDWDDNIEDEKKRKEIEEKIADVEREIDANDIRKKANNASIREINAKIADIRVDANLNNHIGDELVEELDFFIQEDAYIDNNFHEGNLEELLEIGEKNLAKISQPAITFDIDLFDFLSIIEAKPLWNKLVLGDMVHIEHTQLDEYFRVKLVGYEHDVDSQVLQLTFSSMDSIFSNELYLEEVLTQASNAASVVDFNKFNWNEIDVVQSDLRDYISHNLDLSNQALAKAEGQKPILDDRGLWLYKENPDGTHSPEQIRAINNIIAVTKDDWKTVDVAITPKGIVAGQVYGKLGAFVELQADQIIMGDGGSFSDDVLGDNVVKQNDIYNGVVINKNVGVRATASNSLARSTFNASEGILIETRPNTLSEWERNFYVGTDGRLYAKNITLGENAIIGWDSVSNKPNIEEISLNAWKESGYATKITSSGVYTGTLTAAQINAVEGIKLGESATIEWGSLDGVPSNVQSAVTASDVTDTLITRDYIASLKLLVGNEIQMGANAKIHWDNVTDKDIPARYTDAEALSAWMSSGYATNITRNGLYTGTIVANQLLIGGENGNISFDDLNDKPWIPQNASDVGARSSNWVPSWAEIQSKPTILSANDIRTTVVTKSWIGTLGLLVGSEIKMGSNAEISWSRVTSKPSNLAYTGDIPTTTEITNITKNTIDTHTFTGNTFRTSSSNRRVQMNTYGIRSYNASGYRHGFGLSTYGELELHNNGSNIGGIRYDTSGSSPDASNRMFITTSSGYAMKLQSAGDMSIQSGGNIWVHSNMKFVNNAAKASVADSLDDYVIRPYYAPTNSFYADINSAGTAITIRNRSGVRVGTIPINTV